MIEFVFLSCVFLTSDHANPLSSLYSSFSPRLGVAAATRARGEGEREGRAAAARARDLSSPVFCELRHYVHAAKALEEAGSDLARCPCSCWRWRWPSTRQSKVAKLAAA